MRNSLFKWPFALFLSFLVHAGIAGFFKETPDEVLIEGGAAVEVTTLGSAFADTIASGSPAETVEPIDQQIEELKPLEEVIETTDFQPVETITPLHTETSELKSVEPLETTTFNTEVLQERRAADVLADAIPRPTEQQAVEPLESVALSTEILEELQPSDILAPAIPQIDTVPVPQQREVIQPRPEAKPEKEAKPKDKKKQVKNPEPKKPAKKKKVASGDGGKQKTSQKSGTNTGRESAKSKKAGKKKRVASLVGNAAASNYPGKVRRKLVRSFRVPKSEKKKKQKLDVIISFVVLGSGNVSGVRVVRSSGSSVLDNAAVKAVHRAAPFPKIPQAAGRSKWSFRVPLGIN